MFFHYALYFTVGTVVADFYVSADRVGESKPTRLLDWCVVACIPVSVLVSNRGWAPELVLPLHAGLALVAALRGGAVARQLRRPLLVTVGGMCYTIYMYHYLVISGVGRVTAGWFGGLPYELFFLLQLVVHSLAVVSVCVVLFRFTEQPFKAVSAKKLIQRFRPA
jgi:peptidoglycan/LPS O-acetylase OafA/YrhL